MRVYREVSLTTMQNNDFFMREAEFFDIIFLKANNGFSVFLCKKAIPNHLKVIHRKMNVLDLRGQLECLSLIDLKQSYLLYRFVVLPYIDLWLTKVPLTTSIRLKGQTGDKLILMDQYIPLGDTRYVFRISKYIFLMKK